MVDRRVTIGTPVGLHARPAAQLVQKVAGLSIDATTGKEGAAAVEVRSVMSVLPLDIARGGGVVALNVHVHLHRRGRGDRPSRARRQSRRLRSAVTTGLHGCGVSRGSKR